MTEIERFKKLKADLDSLQSRLSSIPAEIDQLNAELAPMQDAAVRAEIEGDKHAANRHAEISRTKAKLADLEAEKKEKAHRGKIMRQVLDEYRTKAAAELQAQHDPRFRKAVKAYAEKVLEAHAAEAALCKLRDSIDADFSEIDAPSSAPTWAPLFVADLTNASVNQMLQRHLERWAAMGYEVAK